MIFLTKHHDGVSYETKSVKFHVKTGNHAIAGFVDGVLIHQWLWCFSYSS